MALSATLVGFDLSNARDGVRVANADALPAPVAAPAASAVGAAAAIAAALQPPVAVVKVGTSTFEYAGGSSQVVGLAGPLRRYRVAVEGGLGVDVASFAAEVDAILADPRGWTAGRTVRLQRVTGNAAAEFTVYLASPVTSEKICHEGWLDTQQFTNCRLSSGKVVINSARWLTAVPGYGAPLSVYRAYAVNHEVGHQLGHGHELCPGPDEPAPVMQQQTLGLRGCVANPWPYLDGKRYQGPAASQ